MPPNETTDSTPDDCEHTKTLITVDTGDGYERKCVLCNDVETLTLDADKIEDNNESQETN